MTGDNCILPSWRPMAWTLLRYPSTPFPYRLFPTSLPRVHNHCPLETFPCRFHAGVLSLCSILLPPRYSSFIPRYSSFLPRYSSFLPRYSFFVPFYSSFLPRYSSFLPFYSSFLPRYSSFLPFYPFLLTKDEEGNANIIDYAERHCRDCRVFSRKPFNPIPGGK